jgi:hypothetical protein
VHQKFAMLRAETNYHPKALDDVRLSSWQKKLTLEIKGNLQQPFGLSHVLLWGK